MWWSKILMTLKIPAQHITTRNLKVIKLKLYFLFIAVQLCFSQNNFEQGESFFKQKKYKEAKQYFEKYLAEKPSDLKTLEYMGDVYAHIQNWDKALFYYQNLRDKYPKTAEYHYKYGGALGMKAKAVNKFKALGMLNEIEQSFLKASTLDPKHIDVRWALVMFYTELPAIVGGSEKKAQKYANELKSISIVDYYLAKGHIEVYFKRYENAEIYLKKAFEIGQSKITFQKLLDLYQNKLKDTKKATDLQKIFSKII